MITIFEENGGEYIKREPNEYGKKSKGKLWVELISPSAGEVNYIKDEFNIPEDFLNYTLDEEEKARIDYDEESECLLVLFDIAVTESDGSYSTSSVGIILKGNVVITVCLKNTTLFIKARREKTNDDVLLESNKLLYKLLLLAHSYYLKCLHNVEKASIRIQKKLQNSVTNKELMKLLNLRNSLIYFLTSLRANKAMVTELLKQSKDEDDIETLENIEVEIAQAIDVCTLQRELLTETMDMYSLVMSNNLSINMRVLTIVTILLAVPTVIVGLWGINVPVPFENTGWGFAIVTLISLMSTLLVTMLVIKIKDGKEKENMPKRPGRTRKKK